jgi:hypothetical protein
MPRPVAAETKSIESFTAPLASCVPEASGQCECAAYTSRRSVMRHRAMSVRRNWADVLLFAVLAGCGGGGGNGSPMMTEDMGECDCADDGAQCLISGGAACVIRDAGGSYRISNGADVRVQDGTADYQVDGGGTITLFDGEATSLKAFESTVFVDGGALIEAYIERRSSAAISDGVTNALRLFGQSRQYDGPSNAEIGGGTVRLLDLHDESSASIYGGIVPVIEMRGRASVTLLDGGVTRCEVRELSSVTVDGGSIDGLFARDNSTSRARDGRVQTLGANDSSRVAVSGGIVDTLWAADEAEVTVNGGTLLSMGLPDATGSISVVGTGFNRPYGPVVDYDGHLTGTLANGDFVDAFIYSNGGIMYLCAPDTAGGCACPLADFESGGCE